MRERIIVICVGALLDILFGDPHWLWHPMRAIGKLISTLEKVLRRLICPGGDEKKERLAGLVLVCLVLLFSVGVPAAIIYLLRKAGTIWSIAVQGIMCYQLLAARSLYSESMKVYRELREKNTEAARRAVSMIVGRDTAPLDEEGITKAAVETVAENTSDGVIAPLLFIFLFGIPGGFFYKAVNTMDSMIGYKNEKYINLGRCAARLDDILNYIPARISAVYMIAAAFLSGLDARSAFRIWRRDKRKHASPNSAQTEAVCAGALNIQLAGDAYYFGSLCKKDTIGDANRRVTAEDIVLANKLMLVTFALVFATGMAVLVFLLAGG